MELNILMLINLNVINVILYQKFLYQITLKNKESEDITVKGNQKE